MKKVIYIVILISLFGIFLFFYINKTIVKIGSDLIRDTFNVEKKQTALVLGARVWSSGQMSDIFADRAKVAIDLYKNGKVEKILVSGDHGREEYDEVNAAKEFLLQNEIQGEDIFLDHAGFDTYDSLYRARDIFQVESLIVVTQDFHLPRALYLARKLNIDALGVSADLQTYIGADRREAREKLARIKAWLNIVFKSKPKFLGEAIPITGDSQKSWD